MPNTDRTPDTFPARLAGYPPLDQWTDEALLTDFAAEISMDTEREVLDMSDVPAALRVEILRRMKR